MPSHLVTSPLIRRSRCYSVGGRLSRLATAAATTTTATTILRTAASSATTKAAATTTTTTTAKTITATATTRRAAAATTTSSTTTNRSCSSNSSGSVRQQRQPDGAQLVRVAAPPQSLVVRRDGHDGPVTLLVGGGEGGGGGSVVLKQSLPWSSLSASSSPFSSWTTLLSQPPLPPRSCSPLLSLSTLTSTSLIAAGRRRCVPAASSATLFAGAAGQHRLFSSWSAESATSGGAAGANGGAAAAASMMNANVPRSASTRSPLTTSTKKATTSTATTAKSRTALTTSAAAAAVRSASATPAGAPKSPHRQGPIVGRISGVSSPRTVGTANVSSSAVGGCSGAGGISTAVSAGFHTTAAMDGRVVSVETINNNLRVMEYAVRGPIVIRAGEIERQLKQQPGSLPFKRVIRSNIGDCHATGQKAITYIRQVLATCTLPDQFLESDMFPSDVRARAKEILASCGGGSVGAYSDSAGVAVIKEHVAEYISKRDGVDTRPENVILQGGASEAIRSILSLLNQPINGQKPGVMIPIPQYPLYSATLAEFNMAQVPYYLDEDHNWALSIDELERALQQANKDGVFPRAICIINPGNPTGSVLSEDNVKDIIRFAYKHNLMLLADEVYQHNVYIGKFHSFRKVQHDLGAPYNTLELVSFMSSSKGFMGECGLRGGYMELVNIDADVKAILLKSISAKLCSTVLGQVAMDCVVKPPEPGEPSYELFIKERTHVLEQLRIKAKMVADTFNSFEGYRCNPVAGAMYAFPQFTIPAKAVEKAKSLNQQPDFFYVKQLLEETGICVVPGSGFGQRPGTYHFRTTILPPTEQLTEMLNLFKDFHLNFMNQYK